MMWRANLTWLALAPLALALGGCQFFFPTPIEQKLDTTKPSVAVRSYGVAFRPGESIKADFFLDGVLAGRGELKVSAPCTMGGKTAAIVTTSGESAGVARMLQKAKSESAGIVDLDTGLPIEARSDSVIGDDHRLAEVLLEKSLVQMRYTRFLEAGPKIQLQDLPLPIDEVPHDGHSALGYMRSWQPEDGTQGFLLAVFGHFPWRADIVMVGKEVLHTEHGDVKTVRIDGSATKLIGKSLMPSEQTPKRPFTMWISDDERRTPVRILVETQIAKATIELTGYSRTEPKAQPLEPCKPLFDEKKLRDDVAADKKTQNADKSDDEQKEEKDALDKLLKSTAN